MADVVQNADNALNIPLPDKRDHAWDCLFLSATDKQAAVLQRELERIQGLIIQAIRRPESDVLQEKGFLKEELGADLFNGKLTNEYLVSLYHAVLSSFTNLDARDHELHDEKKLENDLSDPSDGLRSLHTPRDP